MLSSKKPPVDSREYIYALYSSLDTQIGLSV